MQIYPPPGQTWYFTGIPSSWKRILCGVKFWWEEVYNSEGKESTGRPEAFFFSISSTVGWGQSGGNFHGQSEGKLACCAFEHDYKACFPMTNCFRPVSSSKGNASNNSKKHRNAIHSGCGKAIFQKEQGLLKSDCTRKETTLLA